MAVLLYKIHFFLKNTMKNLDLKKKQSYFAVS
jgi:hypothetical protein